MDHNLKNVCPLLFRIHASCSPTDLLLPTAAAAAVAAACFNILQWPFKRDQLQLAYSVQFEWCVKRPEHCRGAKKKVIVTRLFLHFFFTVIREMDESSGPPLD